MVLTGHSFFYVIVWPLSLPCSPIHTHTSSSSKEETQHNPQYSHSHGNATTAFQLNLICCHRRDRDGTKGTRKRELLPSQPDHCVPAGTQLVTPLALHSATVTGSSPGCQNNDNLEGK